MPESLTFVAACGLIRPLERAVSSAVEHRLHTAGVTGSIPVLPTISPVDRIKITTTSRLLSFRIGAELQRFCRAVEKNRFHSRCSGSAYLQKNTQRRFAVLAGRMLLERSKKSSIPGLCGHRCYLEWRSIQKSIKLKRRVNNQTWSINHE